jgi:hypothetical protein
VTTIRLSTIPDKKTEAGQIPLASLPRVVAIFQPTLIVITANTIPTITFLLFDSKIGTIRTREASRRFLNIVLEKTGLIITRSPIPMISLPKLDPGIPNKTKLHRIYIDLAREINITE